MVEFGFALRSGRPSAGRLVGCFVWSTEVAARLQDERSLLPTIFDFVKSLEKKRWCPVASTGACCSPCR